MPSETSKIYLEHLLASALSKLKLTSQLEHGVDITAPDPQFGDYSTNVALVLAKKIKQNPKAVADKIIEVVVELDKNHQLEKIEEKSGFINFTLSKEYLQKILNDVLEQAQDYGNSNVGQGKTIIVEYFQLNIAKKPHVGHMRSAVVGDCIKRIIKSQGYKVLSDTHVGDWGTQFGIMIAAYKKYGDKKLIEKDPLEELEKLYVRYNGEIEADPDLREIGKQEFAKLEAGDKENRELWEWFNKVSMEKLHDMVKLLQLEDFELHLGESFYEDKMQAVLDDLAAKKLAVTDDSGAIMINLEEYKLDQAILKKSDGATTYLLRDLAKIWYVWKEYGYHKNIYIVDVRQSHHFRQLFKVAELAGWEGVKESVHIDYGLLSLPEGLMSTRKGTIISVEKVVDEATARALKIIEQKNPELKNKEQVARQVGLAALKYFDLSHNPKSDIVFTWDKALSLEGNTGPYLQYTHARIHGILRKSSVVIPSAAEGSLKPRGKGIPRSDALTRNDIQMTSHELSVLRKLNKFPEVVEQVAEDFLPNALANYLFELSQVFNGFYQAVPVLPEADESIRNFRIQLITTTAQVIKNGLNLLGIEAPEEM